MMHEVSSLLPATTTGHNRRATAPAQLQSVTDGDENMSMTTTSVTEEDGDLPDAAQPVLHALDAALLLTVKPDDMLFFLFGKLFFSSKSVYLVDASVGVAFQ